MDNINNDNNNDNNNLYIHNIWANAFRSVEIALKSDDINDNLKEVIALQIKTSPFEDIQLYKFDKKSGNLISAVILDNKMALLDCLNYNDIENSRNNGRITVDRFSNDYNSYVLVSLRKNCIETSDDLFCEYVIKRTWELIAEKIGYQDKIRKAYLTDPLTDIGNRVAYTEMTRNLFNGSKKELTYSLADLFRLKYVNDNYGHKFGDEYIRTAASIIKKELDPNDHIFRIGGDEFAILSLNIKKKEMLEKFAQANYKLNKENLGLELPFPLNINYGVYEGNEELDTFYVRADARLSRQKSKTYKRLNIDRRR